MMKRNPTISKRKVPTMYASASGKPNWANLNPRDNNEEPRHEFMNMNVAPILEVVLGAFTLSADC